MKTRCLRPIWVAALLALLPAAPGLGQEGVSLEPAFSIWDVQMGKPVTQVPAMDVIDVSCGTNGGPPSIALSDVTAFTQCPPEPSGLREVYFAYDDEQDYIAKALEAEYEFLQGGTSIYAHRVVVSVLVDEGGVVRGIRIVTDDQVSNRERRVSVNLARNLKARFNEWNLQCRDVPLGPGENPVGRQLVNEACTGASPEGDESFSLRAYYLRKRGQQALNLETQQVNTGYFSSGTRFELVQAPYEPSTGL